MFKVEKREYVNKTFRISKDLSEKLATVSSEEDVSVNELVSQCCEYALQHRKTVCGKELDTQGKSIRNRHKHNISATND